MTTAIYIKTEKYGWPYKLTTCRNNKTSERIFSSKKFSCVNELFEYEYHKNRKQAKNRSKRKFIQKLLHFKTKNLNTKKPQMLKGFWYNKKSKKLDNVPYCQLVRELMYLTTKPRPQRTNFWLHHKNIKFEQIGKVRKSVSKCIIPNRNNPVTASILAQNLVKLKRILHDQTQLKVTYFWRY